MKKIYLVLALLLLPLINYAQVLYSMSWETSLAVGDTRDISTRYSARGITFFEVRGFLSPNVSIGGSFSWHVLYEEESGTFSDGNRTATGKQKRYLNTYPIMFNSHYYFGTEGDKILPFLGVGVGASNIENRVDMGLFSVIEEQWHFAVAPELGILIPMRGDATTMVRVKYNYYVESDNSGPYQYFNFSLGFAWF